ncbi:probable pectinesterase/pectinesterase inhibitor 46 [Ziziphus jujuba]|uniref:Pectinesterase n=1 Tax=Ziziphus jujuba TaxID=326968 RepID=A0A6P3ZLV7_ZIZJJ|nr:probable pectinesterase/pectinesterase inhibitor 46 [Ziziphus jujuba]
MSSFKALGKDVDEAEQAMIEARKTRKRYIKIVLYSIVFVAVVVAIVVGTTTASRNSGGSSKNGGETKSLTSTVKAVCDLTLYQDTCYRSLTPLANSTGILQPAKLFKLSILVAKNELSKAAYYFSEHEVFVNVTDKMSIEALKNCRDLMGLAMDHLNSSVSTSGDDDQTLIEAIDDLKTWLSTAGTCYETCIDGLKEAKESLVESISSHLKNTTEVTSNSLAIVSSMSKIARRLLLNSSEDGESHGEPKWIRSRDRKLIESWDLRKKAHIVVAQDGSGRFKTIGEALKAVPDNSKKRTVIYVKKGIYYENVRVEKSKWNVVMVGDGMTATIVSGSRNFVDGTPTFSTATFAVFGKGFIGRDIGFRNTAGAIKHQAVALMASADMVVFYRCRMDAFQDTLYAHSNRQFYRECDIYGTVDFIFGNSAVVFQNCNILPRVPMSGQKNTITAQGKVDPNQSTGIAVQNCTIWPFGNLSSVQTFLGRPWKNYSTTIYMNNYMANFIDPKGWMPWVGNSAPSTIFYSEFQNFGPGSSTRNRVQWKGLRSISNKEANRFTVQSFLNGTKWISNAGVPYKSGL